MSDISARVQLLLEDLNIMPSDEQFSVHLSRTLDFLGKSRAMVKYRIEMFAKEQRLGNNMRKRETIILSGSKGEGLTSICESDHDTMIIAKDVICADNVKDYAHMRHKTVFQTERHNTPAGYAQLKQIKNEGPLSRRLIHNSMVVDDRGHKLLSSDSFMTNQQHELIEIKDVYHLERSGPSLPSSDNEGNIHQDLVHAFCCFCPDILQSFIIRPRRYNRPTRTVLEDISTMEAHVVPVGNKGSETSDREWRICFTKAEIHLIHSLNDTETKLYLLLKMITKILKNVSSDITSYVMKNIVMWLVELNPENMFTEELLTHRVIQALVFLKKCIEANYLPSYMIPERNLLAGRMNQAQRRQMATALSTLIKEGGCLLLRCERLRVAMTILYREPDMAEKFKWRRDMVEKLSLLLHKVHFLKQISTGLPGNQVDALLHTDQNYRSTNEALFFLLIPGLWDMIRQGTITEEETMALLHERRQLMLS